MKFAANNSVNQIETSGRKCQWLSISYHSIDKLIFALQSQMKSFYISGLSLTSSVDKKITYDS